MKVRIPKDIRFYALVALSIILVIFCMFLWRELKRPENLPIAHVRVLGHFDSTGKDTIKHAISPYVKTGFFGLDMRKLKSTLMQFPWVANVDIERIWPDTVAIVVQEEIPLAKWNEKSVINPEGKLFFPETILDDELPLVFGPADQLEKSFGLYQQAKKIIKPLGLDINQFNVDKRGILSCILSNELEVEMGRQEPLERLRKLVQIYEVIIGSSGHNARRVDLRYPNGLAVDWK